VGDVLGVRTKVDPQFSSVDEMENDSLRLVAVRSKLDETKFNVSDRLTDTLLKRTKRR
jgi:hypothetical protein